MRFKSNELCLYYIMILFSVAVYNYMYVNDVTDVTGVMY